MGPTRTPSIGQWVDLTHSLLQRTWMPGWYLAVLPELAASFSAAASWNWTDPQSPATLRAEVYGAPAGWPSPAAEEVWQRFEVAKHHPLLRWYAATGDPAAQSTNNVPTAVASRRDQDVTRSLLVDDGLHHQLSIPMMVRGHEHEAFVIGRADPFTDEEVELARTIQPLLMLLHRQARVVAADPAQLNLVPTPLTGQELAVVRLLAQGMTARSLARALAISERTVHKHLQHIYRKLGANDRVSALVAASAAGFLAGGTPHLQLERGKGDQASAITIIGNSRA
jgi:DNA-binding CsgD family transcriptional regulator